MTPSDLAPDCAACAALCCIVPAFDKGDAFAFDKPAGLPCPNLSGHRCRIHETLAARGFAGCVRYDCLGAGQRATALFEASWRDDPGLAAPMAEAFRRLREIQEIRAQLAAALVHFQDAGIARDIAALDARLSQGWTRDSLSGFDMAAARASFRDILGQLRDMAAA
jgi:hypothetical protein